nr:unnamed protein product [Spirometra erinaceieuropaei]
MLFFPCELNVWEDAVEQVLEVGQSAPFNYDERAVHVPAPKCRFIVVEGDFFFLLVMCAEENESCMFETNCCPGLYCVTRGSQGMCQSKSQLRNRCLMDKDCPPSMCCHWGDAGSLGTCAEVCDDAPPTDVPVGSYRGSDFWRLWARKRQLHGKRRLTVE